MLIECERTESVPYLKMAAIELRANASDELFSFVLIVSILLSLGSNA